MAMRVAQGFYCLLVREQVEVGLRKDEYNYHDAMRKFIKKLHAKKKCSCESSEKILRH